MEIGREINISLKGDGHNLSCGRSGSIVKSNVNNASSCISVDVEKSRDGVGSGGSVSSLFNGEWLEERGSAVDFVVDLSDGVQSSGPRA
jgi:hypothetical protein